MEKQKNAVGRRKQAVTRVVPEQGRRQDHDHDKDYKHILAWCICRTRSSFPEDLLSFPSPLLRNTRVTACLRRPTAFFLFFHT